MPPSRLRQLLKFVRVFGLGGGLRLWWALSRRPESGSDVLHLPVPGLAAPLALRKRDLPIFWQIWVMRENDFASLPQAEKVDRVYRDILEAGQIPVIVDCGGHVGLSAVWFASKFPRAKLYSVEPSDANFAMLCGNAKAYPQIQPIHGGVWSQSCHLEISNPGSGSASFRLREVFDEGEGASAECLRAYTIDEIAALEARSRLLLVKIDVEGAESEVFRDPGPWLSQVQAIVIELHDWLLPSQGTSRNFFQQISRQPFDVVLQGENLLAFRATQGPTVPMGSVNAVPQAALIS